MIQTFIVYFFILFIAVGCGYVVSCNHMKLCLYNRFVFFPIVVISMLAGFRYFVGTDWENYYYIYDLALQNNLSIEDVTVSTMEPLYLILNLILSFLKAPYQFFFAIVMGIHLCFLYKSFKDYTWLLPFGLFFYIVSVFTTSLNIQRQTMAFCIFLMATHYYRNGNLFKYVFTIFIAICFHFSSIVLLPIYFLRSKYFSFLDKRLVGIVLYVVSFFLFSYCLNLINAVLENYVTNAKYLGNMASLGNLDMEVNSGMGILIFHMLDLLIIVYSGKLSVYFKQIKFNLLYRVFLTGVILSNIFGNDVFLSRIPFALENVRFLMLAFLVYYLFARKRMFSYVLAVMLLGINLCTFIMSILNGHSGCSPYTFAQL